MTRKGLIIFAREPLPGQVKTRLAAVIGDQAAAAHYEDMLLEVLRTARQLSETETVVFWACEEESLPLLAERYDCSSRRQGPGDLGQRMRVAFEEMFADGFHTCCIIGSDAPDLPVAYVEEAYAVLAASRADAVFGPVADGGYYLLGLRQLWPQLFAGINWSTPSVLTQSLAAARSAGAGVHLLPEWYDIDTIDDLQAYRERRDMTIPSTSTGAI